MFRVLCVFYLGRDSPPTLPPRAPHRKVSIEEANFSHLRLKKRRAMKVHVSNVSILNTSALAHEQKQVKLGPRQSESEMKILDPEFKT